MLKGIFEGTIVEMNLFVGRFRVMISFMSVKWSDSWLFDPFTSELVNPWFYESSFIFCRGSFESEVFANTICLLHFNIISNK